MTERHPILDAPQEKQREALEHLVTVLEHDKKFTAPEPLRLMAEVRLDALSEMADTRLPVSREAWERMWHWDDSIRGRWLRLHTEESHAPARCIAAGGRCAFKPEEE